MDINNIITKDMWMWRSGGRAGMAGPAAPHCDVAGDSCDVTAVCSITVNRGWGERQRVVRPSISREHTTLT